MAKKITARGKAVSAKAKQKTSGGGKGGKPAAKQAKPAKPAKKATATKRKAAKPALGRPLVTGEEMLYMLFKEDYHARQIFDFLRVQRVKELEEYSPEEIVRILSQPVTDTVDRIRRKLAEKNRALKNDAAFVVASRSPRDH